MIICGVLLTLFSGLTILRNFDWKNEYKLYSADIKHSGNSVQVNFMLARNLNGQAYQAESNEDFNRLINEAITYYQRSVELYSGYGNAWFDMGTAAKAIGNMPLTISCYTKASHLLPDFPDPNEQLAFIYQQQGQFDSAIVYYNKALAISESNPDVFLNYGMLRLNQGELRQGIELTKRAVALNPNLYNGFINLGKAYERLGQIRDAIFWYEKALALNPAEQGLAGHIENLRHTTQSVPAP